MIRNGLIIFAREPVPGLVKTRLAASIGESAAAGLYESMLGDVIETCRILGDVETIVYWDCEEASLPLLADRYECVSRRQTAGDIGQRMQAACAEMFESGFDICCVIGSDAPDLPVSYIQEAFRLLVEGQSDAVFGPTHDGGYYLLGLSRIRPEFFTNITWSTPQVLRQSLAAAEAAGVRAALLPEWQDIDTLEDLEKYQERKRVQTGAGAL